MGDDASKLLVQITALLCGDQGMLYLVLCFILCNINIDTLLFCVFLFFFFFLFILLINKLLTLIYIYIYISFLDNDPVPDQIGNFAQEAYSSDILLSLVTHLPMLEFESRKDVIVIFSTMLRRQIGTFSPTIDYLSTRPKLFDGLLISYGNPDIALTAGTIIRDCIKHEPLCRIILQSQVFWTLFDSVANAQFEIATDAFSTITDALCTHQKISSEFLLHFQVRFVDKMKMLMSSDNYVTQRQSLKLISTLIRRRSNYSFMTTYIADPTNLRSVMVLLRNKSPIMKFEAFQIFKIFVANPKKTKAVHDILLKNKTKLVEFLKTLNSPDKKEDETFCDERNFIISQLASLQPFNPSPQQSQATSPQTPTQLPLQQQQPLPPPNSSHNLMNAQAQAQAQMQLQMQLQMQMQMQGLTPSSSHSPPNAIPPTPNGPPIPNQQLYFSNLPTSANGINVNNAMTGSSASSSNSSNGSSSNNSYSSNSANGSNGTSISDLTNLNINGLPTPTNNIDMSGNLNHSSKNSGDFTGGRNINGANASHLNLVNFQQQQQQQLQAQFQHQGGSYIDLNNNSNGTSLNGMGNGSNGSNSRLKPQLIGAVGSGAVLTPVVQTDQVLLYPSSASAQVSGSSSPGSSSSSSSSPSAVPTASNPSLHSSSIPPPTGVPSFPTTLPPGTVQQHQMIGKLNGHTSSVSVPVSVAGSPSASPSSSSASLARSKSRSGSIPTIPLAFSTSPNGLYQHHHHQQGNNINTTPGVLPSATLQQQQQHQFQNMNNHQHSKSNSGSSQGLHLLVTSSPASASVSSYRT